MLDPLFILGYAADKLLGALIEKQSDKIDKWLTAKIEGEPARNAFKLALGAAIHRYASSGTRLDIARPLLEADGLLRDPVVLRELAYAVPFDREPNTEVIGERWKIAVEDPPAWRDFTFEAKLLIDHFRTELRASELFRPIFDSKSLDLIGDQIIVSTETLRNIELQLEALSQLAAGCLGELSRAFNRTPPDIRKNARDYTRYIAEKTRDFVGRDFLFDAIRQFVDAKPCGYLFLRGDPGLGKSALMAQLVKTEGYVHHFNIRAEGICKADTFLKNVCAQLIAVFNLHHEDLPPETIHDAGFLNRLLDEISDTLAGDKKAVILIDALDEVDIAGQPDNTNPLYLPITLPPRIYIVATSRKVPIPIRLECEHHIIDIEHDSRGNIADIHAYLENRVKGSGLERYIATQHLDQSSFVEYLTQKSEGNFIYLRYILPEIESGAYKDLGLDAIPAGLQNYYEDHWRRMRGRDQEMWFDLKLPVIMALTVARRPISIDLIAEFSGVHEKSRVRAVLREWSQFLHEELVEYEGGSQRLYSIYHASFHDFIAKKEEVEDERVSRVEAHKRIADLLWSEFFGNN